MHRKFLTLVLTLALSFVAAARAESGDNLEAWDDRTTFEDDNTHTLDSADEGRTESLDSADERRDDASVSPAPAAPIPAIEEGNWDAQTARAKEWIAKAEERLQQANAAYSEMRARSYPRGEAAEQIVAERESAERDLNDAWDYFARIKRAARDAGRPL
jgi:hypothetical protein